MVVVVVEEEELKEHETMEAWLRVEKWTFLSLCNSVAKNSWRPENKAGGGRRRRIKRRSRNRGFWEAMRKRSVKRVRVLIPLDSYVCFSTYGPWPKIVVLKY